MGRKKIEIAPIENTKIRHATFNHRRTGLMKKAIELSILCRSDVAIVIRDRDQYFQYCSQDIEKFIRAYQEHEGTVHEVSEADLDQLVPGKSASAKAGLMVHKTVTNTSQSSCKNVFKAIEKRPKTLQMHKRQRISNPSQSLTFQGVIPSKRRYTPIIDPFALEAASTLANVPDTYDEAVYHEEIVGPPHTSISSYQTPQHIQANTQRYANDYWALLHHQMSSSISPLVHPTSGFSHRQFSETRYGDLDLSLDMDEQSLSSRSSKRSQDEDLSAGSPISQNSSR